MGVKFYFVLCDCLSRNGYCVSDSREWKRVVIVKRKWFLLHVVDEIVECGWPTDRSGSLSGMRL